MDIGMRLEHAAIPAALDVQQQGAAEADGSVGVSPGVLSQQHHQCDHACGDHHRGTPASGSHDAASGGGAVAGGGANGGGAAAGGRASGGGAAAGGGAGSLRSWVTATTTSSARQGAASPQTPAAGNFFQSFSFARGSSSPLPAPSAVAAAPIKRSSSQVIVEPTLAKVSRMRKKDPMLVSPFEIQSDLALSFVHELIENMIVCPSKSCCAYHSCFSPPRSKSNCWAL